MSTSGFTVTLDDAQVQAALTRLTSRLANMTPIMEDVGRALGNLTEDAFQAEGPGWPQLRPATVKRRGSAHPILQASGGLAASITHGATKDSAWVGTSKKYAAIHQFGGTGNMAPGPRAIPPRPFLPLSPEGTLPEEVERDILAILTDYLSRAV